MSRETNMTVGRPTKLILGLAVPLILTNVGQQLYTVADASIVGRGVGVEALAALGATDWLYWLVLWTVQAMTQGFSVLVSQTFGSNDKKGLRKAITMSVLLCAAVGILLTVVFVSSAGWLLHLLDTPENIYDGAHIYLTMMYAGTLITMAYNMAAAILRALGDGKSPLIAMFTAGCLNIVLDLLFVIRFGWGIPGAAAATLLAQLFAFAYCVIALRKIPYASVEKPDWQPDSSVIRRLCHLGLPLALQHFVIVISGIILKKTRIFAGDPAPFVMELPAYHAPSAKNVLHSMWERGWSFIKRAGTVILVSAIVIWFMQGYGWEARIPEDAMAADAEVVETVDAPVTFGAVENTDNSILGRVGSAVAPVFEPLGFGDWKPTVATVLGLVAKEEVVNVFGILYNTDTDERDTATLLEEGSEEEVEQGLSPIAQNFDEMSGGYGRLAAFAFMIFNLLCAPCFAAIGAIKREMNNARWTWFAIGYQCVFAYVIALIVFRLGILVAGAGFTVWTAVALVLLAGLIYLLVRPNRYDENHLTQKVGVGA